MSSANSEAVIIRPVWVNEAPLLAAIHEKCFVRHWNKEEFSSILKGAGALAWLAEREALCGMILCRNLHEEAEILTLGVCPQYRRHGLAKRLLNTALADLKAKGCRRLWLEVSEHNGAACSFYEKAGFTLISRRKEYYRESDNSYTDALVMSYEFA